MSQEPSLARPEFRTVLGVVTILTLLAYGGCVALSFIPEPTPLQEQLYHTLEQSWHMGFGAILGLLGGNLIQREQAAVSGRGGAEGS